MIIPEGKVASIKIGSSVVWTLPQPLPDGYQKVEYIASSGTQHIDTRVLASNYEKGIHYEFDGVVTALDSGVSEYLFGALNSGCRSANLELSDSDMRIKAIVGSGWRYYVPFSLNERFKLKMFANSNEPSSTTMSKNDVDALYMASNSIGATAMPSANIYLLRVNGSSAAKSAQCRIYGFKMYKDDGTPIRNFIPCYRTTDGIVGLYDTVEGVFYTNSGTGVFVKGVDI